MTAAYNSTGNSVPKEVEEVLNSFVLPPERLVKISEDMEAEFITGLASSTSGHSSIAMLPSFVPALPDGSGKRMRQTLGQTGTAPTPQFHACRNRQVRGH